MDNDYALKRRLEELADRAYTQGRYVFTDFLNQNELSVFYSMKKDISYVPFKVYGGMDMAERCMIGFGSKELCGYDIEFPIVCLEAKPLIAKFADKLNHRDFLGALMNLGIVRETLGDIIVKDNEAIIFCNENVAEYICDNMDFVKHTHIKITKCSEIKEAALPSFVNKEIIVSSNRIDAIVAKVYNMSREQALDKFRDKKVFLNGRVMESNSQSLKPSDVVSVRGNGKFIFNEEGGKTQKNRLYVSVSIYA